MAIVYTNLDSVLDTRLSFLGAITENGKYNIGELKNYSNRYKNNFGCLSDFIFNSYFKYRNKHVLTNAYPVETLSLIQESFKDSLSTSIDKTEAYELYVNTYPYDLFESEINIIVDNLFVPLFPGIVIRPITVSDKEITPEWILEKKIDVLVMYNGLEWIESKIRDNSLLNTPLIGKTLIAPLILSGEVKSSDITPEFRESMLINYRMLMNVYLTPSGAFSLMGN